MSNSPKISVASHWKRVALSLLISVSLLILLWWLVSPEGKLAERKTFLDVLYNTVWPVASLYIITALLGTLLRSERYRALLKADGGEHQPGSLFMFLVTLCRNMFVDMVPARIGELSYVLMLNKGGKVRVSSGLSTLFISVVLDIVALAMILMMIVFQSLASAGQVNLSVGQALVAASVIVIVTGGLIYVAVPVSHWFARLLDRTRVGLLQRSGQFLAEVGDSIKRVELREILWLTIMQSLGIRVLKYGGLLLLFIAVTQVSYPDMAALPWWQVLPAFISSEAAASLPVPTFMSFGTYESGGVLAFSILGFAAADILVVVFVIHLLSQVVDYTLGGLGLMGFLFYTAKNNVPVHEVSDESKR